MKRARWLKPLRWALVIIVARVSSANATWVKEYDPREDEDTIGAALTNGTERQKRAPLPVAPGQDRCGGGLELPIDSRPGRLIHWL